MLSIYIQEIADKTAATDGVAPLLAIYWGLKNMLGLTHDIKGWEACQENVLLPPLRIIYKSQFEAEADELSQKIASYTWSRIRDEQSAEAENIKTFADAIKKQLLTPTPFPSGLLEIGAEFAPQLPRSELVEFLDHCESTAIREGWRNDACLTLLTGWIPAIRSVSQDFKSKSCEGSYIPKTFFRYPEDSRIRNNAPRYEVLLDPRHPELLDSLRHFYSWLDNTNARLIYIRGDISEGLGDERKALYRRLFQRWGLTSLKLSADLEWAQRKLRKITAMLDTYRLFCDPIEFQHDSFPQIYCKMHFEGIVRYVEFRPSLHGFIERNKDKLSSLMSDFEIYAESVSKYLASPSVSEDDFEALQADASDLIQGFDQFSESEELKGLFWKEYWTIAIQRGIKLCERKYWETPIEAYTESAPDLATSDLATPDLATPDSAASHPTLFERARDQVCCCV